MRTQPTAPDRAGLRAQRKIKISSSANLQQPGKPAQGQVSKEADRHPYVQSTVAETGGA